MVVEIWAAVAGASVGVASAGLTGINRQSQQGRDSLVRLTTAVDNLAGRMDILHADIRTRDQEIFARLSMLEQSVARLEGHSNRN
jgi:hypothetical protein